MGAIGTPTFRNGDVMGGRSNCGPTVADGKLEFSGKLSLANNGGFSSVRSVGRTFDRTGVSNFREIDGRHAGQPRCAMDGLQYNTQCKRVAVAVTGNHGNGNRIAAGFGHCILDDGGMIEIAISVRWSLVAAVATNAKSWPEVSASVLRTQRAIRLAVGRHGASVVGTVTCTTSLGRTIDRIVMVFNPALTDWVHAMRATAVRIRDRNLNRGGSTIRRV